MITSSEPIIKLNGVHFTYNAGTERAIEALRGIDLEVRQGEYVAIIGHNGSGKSTLAKHLNALLIPTTGDVWIQGMNTKDPDRTRDIRSRVGMVFQVPDNQIVATVVEEDVAFGPENLGVPEEELEERVRWALEVVDLWPYRKRAPHRLSEGQKQRVAIAGAIAMRPRCLVLDEATALLDSVGRKEVLSTVRKLHEEGVTIIAITHFMEEAVEADRVVVLDEGRIAREGTPRQVFRQVEELRALQLDIPQPTELAHTLHRGGANFPPHLLTVDEVVEAACQRASSRRSHPIPADSSSPFVSTNRPNPLIRVHDLHHTYLRDTPLETVALRGMEVEIGRGEAVGIIGRTGAGKSTLVQHLNGLIRPHQRGMVVVDGQDLSDPKMDVRALRQRVGLVFQRPEQQLFERLVGDDIAFGARQLGLRGEELRERVRWAMEMVGLNFEAFKDRYTFSLSGGEMRRAALAGVLALRPEVLILDESTAGLDPQGRKDFLARIADLHRQHGLTLIFVSARMEDLTGLVDRIYVLDGGRAVMQGTPREAFSQPELLARYGLGVPPITEVTHELRARGWPLERIALTVPEAAEAIGPFLMSR